MTDAPEWISAFRWPHGGRAWRELDMDAPVYAKPYIRADLVDAQDAAWAERVAALESAIAAARAEAEKWQMAFAAQSRKLQAALDMGGDAVRRAVAGASK